MADEKPMTAEELNEIEARLNAATPGPWRLDDPSDAAQSAWARSLPVNSVAISWDETVFACGISVAATLNAPDARFVASAPADVARLLGEVRRLTNLWIDEGLERRALSAEAERDYFKREVERLRGGAS